jgi:hypothetical protein
MSDVLFHEHVPVTIPMRICAFVCAVVVAAAPVSAQEETLEIRLLPGHPVYHESEQEAGGVMALSIAPQHDQATELTELCEELRLATGLGNEHGGELHLETIYVVPHKGMAVEGHYLPNDGRSESDALVPGDGVPRETLDNIVGRAGIPPSVLNERDVEHDIWCEMGEPLWHVAWYDVRPVGDEEPDAVIERAYRRFLAVHESVVEHNTKDQSS